jgi:hypothetical protein
MRGKRGELTVTFLASKIAPGFSTLFLVGVQREAMVGLWVGAAGAGGSIGFGFELMPASSIGDALLRSVDTSVRSR